jgi:hypothetical protein
MRGRVRASCEFFEGGGYVLLHVHACLLKQHTTAQEG